MERIYPGNHSLFGSPAGQGREEPGPRLVTVNLLLQFEINDPQ